PRRGPSGVRRRLLPDLPLWPLLQRDRVAPRVGPERGATNRAVPMTEGSRTAARLAFWAGALFIACLAAMHLLAPELDPSWHFISEYEIGPYGWIMQLAFLALAASCVSLAIAVVPQVRTVGGYLGLVMLL